MRCFVYEKFRAAKGGCVVPAPEAWNAYVEMRYVEMYIDADRVLGHHGAAVAIVRYKRLEYDANRQPILIWAPMDVDAEDARKAGEQFFKVEDTSRRGDRKAEEV